MTGIRFLLASAILFLGASTATAQLPQTRITSVFPPGGQQGVAVDVAVGGGTDLDELDQNYLHKSKGYLMICNTFLLFKEPGIR